MTLQILHYEFMGPIRLGEWGPPMKEVVYILLAKSRDKFSLIYADQCSESDEVGFFTKSPRFKCWIEQAGAENNLYVAIHPMFGSSATKRRFVVGKIVSKYSPHCNMVPEPEPAWTGQDASAPRPDSDDIKKEYIKCACCGSDMHVERELRQSNVYRCDSCGISDTRLR